MDEVIGGDGNDSDETATAVGNISSAGDEKYVFRRCEE